MSIYCLNVHKSVRIIIIITTNDLFHTEQQQIPTQLTKHGMNKQRVRRTKKTKTKTVVASSCRLGGIGLQISFSLQKGKKLFSQALTHAPLSLHNY